MMLLNLHNLMQRERHLLCPGTLHAISAGMSRCTSTSPSAHTRARKLKCNGTRPICDNCSKPRIRNRTASHARGGKPTGPGCTWDGEDPRGNENEITAGESNKRARIEELTERVGTPLSLTLLPWLFAILTKEAFYETLLATAAADLQEEPVVSTDSSILPTPQDPLWAGFTLSGQHDDLSLGSQRHQAGTSGAYIAEWSEDNPTEVATQADTRGMVRSEYAPAYPDKKHVDAVSWPSTLPCIDTVSVSPITAIYVQLSYHQKRMIDIFFNKVPLWPKMLRKSSIQRDLRRPPSHHLFPVSC